MVKYLIYTSVCPAMVSRRGKAGCRREGVKQTRAEDKTRRRCGRNQGQKIDRNVWFA